MNIEKLLEYARIDAEMAKLNLAFNAEAEVKEYKLQTKRYKDASDLIGKLNAEADDIIKQMSALQDRYQDAMHELNEYKATVAEIEDENEADFYIKNVEKMVATLSAMAGDIAQLSKRVADVRQQTGKAFAVAQEATKRIGELAPAYKEITKRYEPDVAAIKARLAAAAEGLGEALNIYLNLKRSGVKNRIVKVNGNNCGGCFMDIDVGTRDRINTVGYVLCPNCGRILYN